MRSSRDVVVVGAGPAGSAAAYFLARGGASVTLVDKSSFPRDKVCGDAVSPRALAVLRDMGIYERVASCAHSVSSIDFRAPNGRISGARVPSVPGSLAEILVLPRRVLDTLLVERATEAGASLRTGKAVGLTFDARGTSARDSRSAVSGIRFEDGSSLSALMLVLATGAALPLVREAGLAAKDPVTLVAARRYFHDVSPLNPALEFVFDGLPLPGYAWLFPIGAGSANVGCGWTRATREIPRAGLDRLVAAHQYLSRVLSRARPDGPARGHPLRVDFLRSKTTAPGVVAIGEAAGLVNPVTGEGIDYALESGRMAARAILDAAGDESSARSAYAKAADGRFRRMFRVFQIAERLYYNSIGLNQLIGRNPVRQRLVNMLVEVCFGVTRTRRLLEPRMVFDILRP